MTQHKRSDHCTHPEARYLPSGYPTTYGEALRAGWHESHVAHQRGYISRRCDVMRQLVMVGGRRTRPTYYVLVPCWHSTRYCMRQYLLSPAE